MDKTKTNSFCFKIDTKILFGKRTAEMSDMSTNDSALKII